MSFYLRVTWIQQSVEGGGREELRRGCGCVRVGGCVCGDGGGQWGGCVRGDFPPILVHPSSRVLVRFVFVAATSTTSEGSPTSTVFVGGVPPEADEEELRQFFAPVALGKILEVRLKKGFAFVQWSSPRAAQEACKLGGLQLLGRFVTVQLDRPRPRQ